MENSTYVPNPLPPPALVVFSQAGGLPEALRMQRPFNPQAPENKDLHVPFSAAAAAAAGFGLRHMDSYPGLPAHLLHHLQPQFLHPALDPRVPFGSGAFRPLSTNQSETKGFPSAFAPPSKCLKIETANNRHELTPTSNHLSTLFSPGAAAEGAFLNGQSSQNRADSSSPASASVSPPIHPVVKEESSDAPMSEDREGTATPGSEGTERSTPEEGRGFRLGPMFGPGRCGQEALGLGLGLGFAPAYRFATGQPTLSKGRGLFDQGKKKFQDPSCCPACGVTLRPGELESHYIQELDRLYKMSHGGRRLQRPALPPAGSSANSATSATGGGQLPPSRRDGTSAAPGEGTPESRWDTYQRIKANRQGRLRVKNRKRKMDETSCPICNERLSGTDEELNRHVDGCLRRSGNNDEDETVDVEGVNDVYEEYTWAGQRRVRPSSMLLGGFAAAVNATTITRPSPVDEDVDLVVDGDDSATYGPPQYSEIDVVLPVSDGSSREDREREALREAVISPDGINRSTKPPTPSSTSTSVEVKDEPMNCGESENTESAGPEDETVVCNTVPLSSSVVEALKSRIRDLELEIKRTSDLKFKCLICMETFKKPVISVCCWHVHCEQCWLHTLGAKKLCPQCNMITSPSDLRRIYM